MFSLDFVMKTMLGKVWYLWFCNDGYPCLGVRPQLCTYRIRGCDLLTELQGGWYNYISILPANGPWYHHSYYLRCLTKQFTNSTGKTSALPSRPLGTKDEAPTKAGCFVRREKYVAEEHAWFHVFVCMWNAENVHVFFLHLLAATHKGN